MAKKADRIRETTITTGTGTLSLGGADGKYRAFLDADSISSGDYVYYTLEGADGSWESGAGLITSGSPNTLARSFIFDSSNSGSAIDLPAGIHRVFCAPSTNIPRVCRAARNTNFALPSGSSTPIQWSFTHVDDWGGWDTTPNPERITLPAWATRFRGAGAVYISGSAAARYILVELKHQATVTITPQQPQGMSGYPAGGVFMHVHTGLLERNAATDYVIMFVRSNGTGDNVAGASGVSYGNICWLEVEITE